jgi:signal transduction histidine kinase/GAF domain-containing protein
MTPDDAGDGAQGAEADQRLLEILTSLNEIGLAINQIGRATARDSLSLVARLALIAESAIKVLPGASAVIYTYDEIRQVFDPASRVSAGEAAAPVPGDEPRPDGMGRRAVNQRRRVISYEEDALPIHPIKVQAGARTVACFPLIIGEQILGVLYVYLCEARTFTPIELLMLENFVNHAAMVIYQTRQLAKARQDLVRKENELSRLHRAGLLISSRPKLDETLVAILHMALEVTNARYGIFRLTDKQGQVLVTQAVAGELLGHPLVDDLPLNTNSIMGWVACHRQAACIPDLRAEPWARIYIPFDTDIEMRSELAVPLVGAGNRLEGVLNLESPQVNAFSEEDSHLLQALATQAVIAIQEARLLDALQEIAQLLLIQPVQQVCRRLASLASDLLNAAASAIWTLEGDQLTPIAISGAAGPAEPAGSPLPLHGSLVGRAVLTRQPVVSDESCGACGDPAEALGLAWRQALVVPLFADEKHDPIGAFGIFSTDAEPGRFAESDWDKKVLTCLAYYAALAVQNEARRQELQIIQERHAISETFAAVGDIAANLMHNLNNKVGTIPVRIQGLQDKRASLLQADRYLATNLEEIEKSAREAMETVRANLSLLHPIHLVPVNMAACVRAAIQSANLPDGLEIFTESLDELPLVLAGERNLTLAFSNLLENAADAMKGKGKITIRGACSQQWVQVTVRDNGPGISPELHDRIFELHFSGRSSSRPGKLGFGLWWVKTMMTRLGGYVNVESGFEGGEYGTTFTLSLPAALRRGENR